MSYQPHDIASTEPKLPYHASLVTRRRRRESIAFAFLYFCKPDLWALPSRAFSNPLRIQMRFPTLGGNCLLQTALIVPSGICFLSPRPNSITTLKVFWNISSIAGIPETPKCPNRKKGAPSSTLQAISRRTMPKLHWFETLHPIKGMDKVSVEDLKTLPLS